MVYVYQRSPRIQKMVNAGTKSPLYKKLVVITKDWLFGKNRQLVVDLLVAAKVPAMIYAQVPDPHERVALVASALDPALRRGRVLSKFMSSKTNREMLALARKACA